MHEWAYLFTQDTLSQLGANQSLFLLLYCACLVEYKYKFSSLFHLTCSSPRSITLQVSNFYFKYCFQLSNTFSILQRPKTRKIYDSVSYWPIAVDKCQKKNHECEIKYWIHDKISCFAPTNSEERKIKQTRNNYACLKTKVINVFQNLSND